MPFLCTRKEIRIPYWDLYSGYAGLCCVDHSSIPPSVHLGHHASIPLMALWVLKTHLQLFPTAELSHMLSLEFHLLLASASAFRWSHFNAVISENTCLTTKNLSLYLILFLYSTYYNLQLVLLSVDVVFVFPLGFKFHEGGN